MGRIGACVGVCLLQLWASSAEAQYWHGVDTLVPLTIDSTRVSVKPIGGFSTQELEEAVTVMERFAGVPEEERPPGFVVLSLVAAPGYETFLDTLRGVAGVDMVEPFYTDEFGRPALIGSRFVVSFDEFTSGQEIDSINETFGVEFDREIQGMTNVFLLSNTAASGMSTLEIANSYHALEQTLYSHPDMRAYISTTSYTLYDYYNSVQPQIKKVVGDFNSASVWDMAGLARPVVVAMVDDGVDAHEDLPPSRIIQGYDVAGSVEESYDHDYDPRPGPANYHGMATTGIVAASHSASPSAETEPSSGVVSVAPNVVVMPIKIFNDESGGDNYNTGIYPSDLAAGITYAWTHGADVISNSWGYPNPREPQYPVLNDALERAASFGRGGRGCPVIFAAGNTTMWYSNPNGVAYPAKLPYCFAVGAVGLDDYRRAYSRYGSELDLVAPSDDDTIAVWTLDQMDAYGANTIFFNDCPPGANDVDYNCHFNGTSAACPLVAGTAALLLSKDSTLSAQAIYYILRNSADTSLVWGNITPGNWEYGNGRLDAFRAVLSLSRGDADNSGTISPGDITFLINYLFINYEPAPWPDRLLGDINCDGDVSMGDLAILIDHLYINQTPLPIPCFAYND